MAAGEPGGSLRYTVDGVAVTTYDPTALADGAHTVAVTQTDAAGNVSPTTSLSFVLDRTAPSAPSLVLGSDTGASASDGVTRDATLVVAAGERAAACATRSTASRWRPTIRRRSPTAPIPSR